MQKIILQEFQDFLRVSNLVQEKYITYYANWASKFLLFSNENKELNRDLQIEKFLNSLRSRNNIAEWQVRQAHDAVRLYLNHFNKSSYIKKQHSFNDIDDLVEKTRQAIRIRHYSYRTERTYLDWLGRFLNYPVFQAIC